MLDMALRLFLRLVEMDLEHNASLSGAVIALRQDEQTRLSDAVAKTKAEEEVIPHCAMRMAWLKHFIDAGEIQKRTKECKTTVCLGERRGNIT